MVAADATGLPQASGMRYATKAAWAAAKALELRQQANRIGYTSNWRRARSNSDARHNLRREAERFERMAERFAAQRK